MMNRRSFLLALLALPLIGPAIAWAEPVLPSCSGFGPDAIDFSGNGCDTFADIAVDGEWHHCELMIDSVRGHRAFVDGEEVQYAADFPIQRRGPEGLPEGIWD